MQPEQVADADQPADAGAHADADVHRVEIPDRLEEFACVRRNTQHEVGVIGRHHFESALPSSSSIEYSREA